MLGGVNSDRPDPQVCFTLSRQKGCCYEPLGFLSLMLQQSQPLEPAG